jgi:sodium transport system permease protein
MTVVMTILRKELLDHARDVRSLVSATLLAVLGPAVVFLVALSGQAGGSSREGVLLGMLSVFALVSAFSGANDVAMDVTAGERERRSLLPLLLTSVPTRQIVLGKWSAVATFALTILGVSLVASAAVLSTAAPAVLLSRGGQLGIWIALGLIPLTFFGAAMSVLVALVCRTTKEASTAMRLLVFAPMVSGMFLVFFPTWAERLWFVPLLGQQALVALADPATALVRGSVLAVLTAAGTMGALMGAVSALGRAEVLSA